MHFPDAAAAAGTTGDAAIPDHFTNTVANSNTIANTGPPTAAEGEKPTLALAMVQNLINGKIRAMVIKKGVAFCFHASIVCPPNIFSELTEAHGCLLD